MLKIIQENNNMSAKLNFDKKDGKKTLKVALYVGVASALASITAYFAKINTATLPTFLAVSIPLFNVVEAMVVKLLEDKIEKLEGNTEK